MKGLTLGPGTATLNGLWVVGASQWRNAGRRNHRENPWRRRFCSTCSVHALYMYTYIFTYVYVFTVYIYIHLHSLTMLCMYIQHIYIYIHMYVYKCVYIYIYIYLYAFAESYWHTLPLSILRCLLFCRAYCKVTRNWGSPQRSTRKSGSVSHFLQVVYSL